MGSIKEYVKIMKISFERSYILIENGKGPVYIALHSGPMTGLVANSKERDTGSDYVSTLCLKKTGGKLILSLLPRNQPFGIDFNREVPTEKDALKYWGRSLEGKSGEHDVIYGFTSYDSDDYKTRSKLYEDFWKTVNKLGNSFVLLHTLTMKAGNYPSLIDFITFDDKGVDRNNIEMVVSELNKKYKKEFKKFEQKYREAVFVREKIEVQDILKQDKSDYLQELFDRDMSFINKYCEKGLKNKLKNNFNKENYIKCVGNSLNNIEPSLTVERIFSGKKAIGVKKKIIKKGKKAIEIEINEFMSTYFPVMTSNIIVDTLKRIGYFNS